MKKLLFLLASLMALASWAQDVPAPVITNVIKFGSQEALRFPLSPGAKAYTIYTSTNLNSNFIADPGFNLEPFYSTNTIFGLPEFVIDNQSARIVGSWTTGTSSADKFSADYRYRNQGAGSSYVQFTPNIKTAGEYDIYEWHPQGSNRTTNAPFVITYSGGSTTMYVNEQVNGGKWNLIGRFNFAAGTNGNVRVTDAFPDAGQVVVADAVRFIGYGMPPEPTDVISIAGFEWRATNSAATAFHRVQVTSLNSNEVLAATALNRLAYGPTPDELERILTGPSPIGGQGFIDEQLSPETINEDINNQNAAINTIEAKFAPQDVPVTSTNASLADLRAWHTLRAVGARRQLLEVLLQFLENHFVTQYTKSVDYFDPFYDDGTLQGRFATQFEQLENAKWRAALLNPSCTFYDLLKISAESPAMIVYLDTVQSRGDISGGTNRVANENYARELFELFTFGVDNGYDQTDIVECSKCWTGWRVEIVDSTNAFNVFAPKTTNNLEGVTNNFTAVSNLLGCWVFNYKSQFHNNNSKVLFTNKFIPARFGAPYTTKTYGTNTTPGLYQFYVPARSGTNAIEDGYDVIRYLADLPFTQEFISVKLCRLFVHDDFYVGNDFTNPTLSPEAQLIKQCMAAWENGSPKGQIRDVLRVISNSSLFRGQGAAMQKVKTPLEFVVSSVRALRSSTNGTFTAGSFSSDTDGAALATPMSRMGGMNLFDRGDPDGYPESAAGWISAGTITERIRFVQSLCLASGQNGHSGSQSGTGNDAGASVCTPVELLKSKVPSANWTNAGAVADYFLGILFPAEGAGNLQPYRAAAIDYLNSADNGASSPFSSLSVSSTAGSTYDTRVRGMVAMLMSTQRFQEQ